MNKLLLTISSSFFFALFTLFAFDCFVLSWSIYGRRWLCRVGCLHCRVEDFPSPSRIQMALHSSTISLSSLNIEFLLCCVQSFFSTAWFQICIIYVAPFAHSFNDTRCIRMKKCDSPYQREERTPFLKKHRMSKGIRALNLKNVFAFCVKRPFVREILIKVKHISGRYSNFFCLCVCSSGVVESPLCCAVWWSHFQVD